MRTRYVLIAAVLAAANACGGGGGDSSTAPRNNNPPAGNTPPPVDGISVNNNAFSPSTKTVAAGTAVSWAWNSCVNTGDPYGGTGETCVAHGVDFDDGISSPTQDKGTYSRTFTAAGTYNYHCAVHGSAMQGTITVQ